MARPGASRRRARSQSRRAHRAARSWSGTTPSGGVCSHQRRPRQHQSPGPRPAATHPGHGAGQAPGRDNAASEAAPPPARPRSPGTSDQQRCCIRAQTTTTASPETVSYSRLVQRSEYGSGLTRPPDPGRQRTVTERPGRADGASDGRRRLRAERGVPEEAAVPPVIARRPSRPCSGRVTSRPDRLQPAAPRQMERTDTPRRHHSGRPARLYLLTARRKTFQTSAFVRYADPRPEQGD